MNGLLHIFLLSRIFYFFLALIMYRHKSVLGAFSHFLYYFKIAVLMYQVQFKNIYPSTTTVDQKNKMSQNLF